MSDIHIRKEGRAGRITLNRPEALNALTYDMCLAVDAALQDWRDDADVRLILLDAAGERAFCAGGDIAELYATGRSGDFAYGRRFWRDEYRMNARIATYPKPVVAFLQGFTMGGGVGLGCHASLRIVGDHSRIAMPECGIGLVPDVGGSHILARANAHCPGLGSWIGATGLRMGHGEARLGFADAYCPEPDWDALKTRMIETGLPDLPDVPAPDQGDATITPANIQAISACFTAPDPIAICDALASLDDPAAQSARKALHRASPLSLACHQEILRRLEGCGIEDALRLEYRFVWRAMEHGDFLEGIRAQIIDKDRNPRWRHATLADVTAGDVDAMLAPLGENELSFDI